MRRAFGSTLIMLLMGSIGLGCTKLVPLEDPTLSESRTSVITFKDGSTIEGKIDLDEGVIVVTQGSVYGGVIYDLTDEEIILDECRYLRMEGDHGAASDRLQSARVDLAAELLSFEFRRADIDRVEQVKVDPMKTATRAAFWAVTGVVSVFLMQERS
jgi:hypothetical protein